MASDFTEIEAMLQRYYSAGNVPTSQQLHQLESRIHQFFHRQDFWEFSANCITHCSAYLKTHCYQEMTKRVRSSWTSDNVPNEFKVSVLDFCFNKLSEDYKSRSAEPVYVKNALIKLIIEIGKRDWADDVYPHYFDNIRVLIDNAETSEIGILLLEKSAEEFCEHTGELDSIRRQKLLLKFQDCQTPSLELLSGIMKNNIERLLSTDKIDPNER